MMKTSLLCNDIHSKLNATTVAEIVFPRNFSTKADLRVLLMAFIDKQKSWNYIFPMQTTVTTKNMVTIPAALSRKMNITPGCRLEWHEPNEGGDEVRVRVIPTRGELARRLMGAGKVWSPERDAVAELVAERLREEEEQTLS